jgi:hypothetical protein
MPSEYHRSNYDRHGVRLPMPLPSSNDHESADRRRTEQNNRILAGGYHPATREQLILVGATCGGCAHHFERRRNKTWHKCDYTATGGAGSDIRVGWPACTRWEPREGKRRVVHGW